MYDTVREEMTRYPVFSYQENHTFDESEVFKDEDITKNNNKKNIFNSQLNHPYKKRTQTIVNIYDKINSNNANDPLYPKNYRLSQQYKTKHYSTINSARNPKFPQQRDQVFYEKKSQRNINKFVGEIATSITNQDPIKGDLHRLQKISLLKRIIQHYNLKSIQKKYYSNLIKSFGLKIESINSEDLAMKKDLHPRNMQTLKQVTQPCEEHKDLFQENYIKQQKTKKTQYKRFKPSLSFMNYKPLMEGSEEIGKSEKNIKVEEKRVEKKNLEKMRRTLQSNQKIIQKPLRLQNSSIIESKILKYRQFLFILNYSNHLYRQLDFHRHQIVFKYFVGRGNNANLIKSLMKKRFWFEQTYKIQQAHFIWTQIKVNQVFEKQKSSQSKIHKRQLQNQLTIKNPEKDMEKQKQKDKDQQKNKDKDKDKNKIFKKSAKKEEMIKNIKYGKNQVSAKHFEPLDPILKILTMKEMKEYKEIEDNFGLKRNVDFIRKVKVSKRKLKIQQQDTKVHNHFPLNGLLGNKKAMYYNLREYCRLTQKKISDYVPLTFHIKKGFLDEQYKNLSYVFAERKKQKFPNYWIIKPGQFSNRGQGISCTNKLEEIRKRIIETRKKGQSSLIVQLYLSNPLLYNSRKFDIRVFMMMTCVNGKLKGYWYQEGYVRTSSFIWSLSEIQDKYIHLTNDAIQKTCYEYGMFEPGNKLSFNELQRYLSTLPNVGKNLDFFSTIYPRMRSIATDAIKSVFLNLDRSRLRDNFEIFGLDFMLDNTFKPWLIEVNTNPCLQINCPLLERIIPHMLQNGLRISIDPLFPPPLNVQTDYKYAIPENALHYNKFELIFDENRDGVYLEKIYRDSKILEQLDDIEEDQQEFEEEGEEIQYEV